MFFDWSHCFPLITQQDKFRNCCVLMIDGVEFSSFVFITPLDKLGVENEDFETLIEDWFID